MNKKSKKQSLFDGGSTSNNGGVNSSFTGATLMTEEKFGNEINDTHLFNSVSGSDMSNEQGKVVIKNKGEK
ncbi:hypothetical protein [Clostridium lacusfryxellense]|uniref:hypothetical protein n=1 Tax=Clostridium lacusfryxellense TaxID=205328 RepID=UPI001C0CE45D|nr:hypothetical protein [Clostridium lacusfryxellense]MBU3109939.1 hypothetical protein [Clostridium lacusfryxellense]